MPQINSYLILLSAYLVLLCACGNAKSEIDMQFDDMEASLSPQRNQAIILCQDVACIEEQWFAMATSGEDANLSYSVAIDCLFDSLEINSYQRLVVLMAYSKAKRGEQYSWTAISEEVIQYFVALDKEREAQQIETNKRFLKIAQDNYDSFWPGDTICLTYPLREKGDNATYFGSYDVGSFKDTLLVKCVLLRKEYHPDPGIYATATDLFYFHVKAIWLSEDPYRIMIDKVSAGDEFDAELFGYQRPIYPTCR